MLETGCWMAMAHGRATSAQSVQTAARTCGHLGSLMPLASGSFHSVIRRAE